MDELYKKKYLKYKLKYNNLIEKAQQGGAKVNPEMSPMTEADMSGLNNDATQSISLTEMNNEVLSKLENLAKSENVMIGGNVSYLNNNSNDDTLTDINQLVDFDLKKVESMLSN